MKTVATCAAIASLLVFTAGSAAWAQGYTTNPAAQGYSSQGARSYNQGTSNTNQGSWSPGTQSSTTYPSNQSTSNQGYSANQGSWSPGTQSSSTYRNNESMSNQGYSANQGTWNSGTQGTSTPYGGQAYSQAGYGAGNVTTYQEAEQELGKYGYGNIHDLRAMQGWSANAMRNGQKVHVVIGDNGMIATFPGR
jgi:Ni/Co efflux regulator RcnB